MSNSVFQQTISWYENDGATSPSFTQNVVSNGATNAYSLGSSDVDGDGDIDLLSIDQINNTVLWYENDGASNPGFVTHLVTSGANSPESVAASDIDGDGDLEIVAASQSDNTVAWFTTIQRSVWLTEGSSWVYTEAAFDALGGTLTYNISHGADAELFSIDSNTGQITFANAPLTSAPEDDNSDNVYKVWISVTNGSSTINRSIAVTVYTDDNDDDNDGTPDISDAFPLEPYEQFDNDLDGIGNNADGDDDNDNVSDSEDDSPLGGTNASTPLWEEPISAKPSNTHIISRLIDRAADVHPADVNGDGHIDVLAVSALNDTLAWYQNDGNAVPGFTERLIVSDRSGASSVITADVDNDGDLDVLLVAHFTIFWYENNGAPIPSFTEHLVKNDALGEIRLTLVDIDKDGDLDIFSSWMSGDTLVWYESDGADTPNFTEHIITTTVDGPRSITHGDMDGDGNIDILAASFFDNTLAWYENDGSAVPNFTIQVITTSASEASSVVVADIDGDNDLDIVLGSRDDDTVAWYENDGASNPSFTQRIITSSADGVVSVYVDDVDGDGDLDVLSAQFYGAYISWYENSGTEVPDFIEHTITDKVTSPDKLNEMTPRGAASISTADINGDGHKEVLTSSYFGDFIAWYNLNQKDEWISEGESWAGTEVATDADNNVLSYSIVLGPDSDLFSIDAVNGTLRFENAPLVSNPKDSNGDNVYKVWISASDGASQINRSLSLHVYVDDSDDDDDGVPDLSDAFPLNPEEQLDTDTDEIGNNEDKDDDDDGVDDSKDNAPLDNSHTSAPLWTNGSELPMKNVVTTSAITVNTIHTSDIDGDGDIDLVSASEDSDTVTWYENDGSGEANFTPRIISNSSAGVRSVKTGDINGDGNMDVLSASPVDNTIGWYINDGDNIPNFTSQPITTSAAGAYVVEVADIDDDGDIDILSASQNDENVVWYENDGALVPSFTTHSISRNKVISPITVSTADVNGDNALDVLVAVRGDNSIYWYENDGDTPPNFTERLISNLGGTTVSITAVDMDNDGDTDILTAGENWTIRWYENPGFDAPFFMQHTITDSAQRASAVSVADVDNDGDMDVLASSSQDNTVAWYENDGNSIPQFIEHFVTTSAIGASSVTTADITGDGRLEIVSAFTLRDSGGVTETVAWYSVNQRTATVIQGNTLVITENASDSDANLLTYAISHGEDASHFSINSETGDVTFANAPLVASPEDDNGDNVYEVSIRVTDGFSTLVRSIEVTVTEN